MRKIFTTLKSVVATVVIGAMALATSCSYDDAPLTERVDRVEKDLASLTERVAALEKQLGDEVTALKALIDGKVVVTAVEELDGGATKITLSDGNSFTVYPECTVVDTDTDTNVYITVHKDTDGVLYFAVYENDTFKDWLYIDGEKVVVHDGNDDTQDDNVCDNPYEPVAPMFRVEGEYIEVSIDGGNTWVNSGLTAAAAGAQIFAGVTVNDNNTVTFTLADGSTFDVVIAELIEFDTTRGQLYVKPGETKEIVFTINDAVADVNVMNQPNGWKATVEPKVADEEAGEGDENVDPGMGIMAAGGTEFILKITAPSNDYLKTGYAETAGAIAVHFNSENGACKVGKIAVEIATITLEVDKAGNVTVTNTWIDEYEQTDWGETTLVQEFNNYFVTIMPLEYYQEDLASIYNPDWWEWTVPTASGWINNFFYNVNEEYNTYDKVSYVEGENEKWVFKATIEEIIGALDWSNNLTYENNSFAVIITPTDVNTYSSLLIEQSQVAFFRQLDVNVSVNDTTWNSANLNATLRGANAYHFNVNAKAELQGRIDKGWYDGFEGYYNDYIYSWQNYGGNFGAYTVYSDIKSDSIDVNDLLNYGEDEYPYIYEFAPNTEYIVAILIEEEGKTEYSYSDLKFFEFTTKDLAAAATPFEYTVERDNEKCTYFQITANVTVPDTAVTVYSTWVDEVFQDEDAVIKDYLVANGWGKTDFSEGYTYSLTNYVDAAGTVKYLYIMIVDAEGNYSIGYQELKSNEVVVNEDVELTIENVEFLTEGGVATITVGGLDGVDYTNLKAYVIATDGSSYYMLTEEELQDLAYGNNYRYVEYTTNPFTVTQTADWKYVATEGKTYAIAVAANFADGTVSKTVYEEIAFSEAPEPLTVVSAAATEGATGGDMNYHSVAFTMSDGSVYTIEFRTDDNNYLTLGEYTDSWSNYTEGYYPGYINYAYKNGSSIGWAYTKVSYENDAYTVIFRVTADWQNFEEYTYTGAIEGLDAPVVAGEEEGQTYNYTLTSVSFDNQSYGDVNFKNGDDLCMCLCINPLAGAEFTTATYTKADLDLTNCVWDNVQLSNMGNLGDVTVEITAADGVVTAATVTLVKGADTYVYTL